MVWVIVSVAFVLYYKMAGLSDWRIQLLVAKEEHLNRTYGRVEDHYDLLLPIRALRKAKHFESQLHGGIMIHPYFNYLEFQCAVIYGHIEHVIGAGFSVAGLVIIGNLKSTGMDESSLFAFYSLITGLTI